MAYYIPAPAFSTVPDMSSPAGVMGFNLKVISTTQFTLSSGYARALTNGWGIQYPSNEAGLPSFLTGDITTVGVNGCYPILMSTITLANSTVFGIYAIADSSGKNTPGCIVATGNNFLPAGYDVFRRVGLLLINSSGNTIIPWSQSGNGNEKFYNLQDPIVAVTAGNATAATELDLTSTVGVIKPHADVEVYLNVEITPLAAAGYAAIESNSLTSTGVPPIEVQGSVAGQPNSAMVKVIATPDATTGDASIKYLVDNAGSAVTINVAGFTDSLGYALF